MVAVFFNNIFDFNLVDIFLFYQTKTDISSAEEQLTRDRFDD